MRRSSRFRRLPWCLAFLASLVPMGRPGSSPAPPEPAAGNPFYCSGEITPPVQVEILTATGALQPGAAITLDGAVRLTSAAPRLTLRFTGLDGATLQGTPVLDMGARSAGESVSFSMPAQLASEGRAGFQVLAEVAGDDGELLYSTRAGLYALLRPTGALAGRGGYLALEQQAVEADIQAGRISADRAAAARQAAARIEATSTATPPVYRSFSPMEQQLNTLLGAPAQGYAVPTKRSITLEAGNITVQGQVQWTDEFGNPHPAYGMNVDIYDEDTFVDEYLTTVVTDANGNYQAVVDTDDGIGQGDRDIYVKVRAENSWIHCEDNSNNLYVMTSSVHNETPGGSVIDFSPTAANTGTGPAVSVFEAATWIAAYIAFDANGAALPQVDIVWPNGDDHSFYNGAVRIEEPDRWDWDTVHHEFGHYVMDELNIEDNPGGAHNIGDCIADVHDDKSEGNRLAWGEGWPTFFGTSGQAEMNMASLNVPRVGDVSYQDFEDGNLQYSLESQNSDGRGEDNEVAVQRLLWDLYDSNSDSRDAISRDDNSIWNAIKAGAGSPHILSHYWNVLRSGQPNSVQILMGEIASDQRIGPRLVSPVEGATVSPSNNSFDWNEDVGCPSSYGGNSFDLKFFDANTFALILTIPNIGTSSYALSNTELQSIVAGSHHVLWAVEGRNTSSPATGPYLGESFAITVNSPPVADAGPDQPSVECASHTTTSVQLNGTGSSDPDGDTLTYTWSATGISFNDIHSPTPIGQFPMGTTVVTLTVSDGIEEDTDTVSITVVDTTPPDITCPADVTVECSSHCGVPEDDPQLTAFLTGATATDVCDASPTITDNHPACFPLGTTKVTFYATDDDTNVDSCQAYVTVEDTTPPEITVALDRDVLWPPNHKMATIEASITVTDICDPNPTFVLTSITSSEPDNGLGDGDTSKDIQGAAYGTPDSVFALRSERMGLNDGRTYTIIYTASDHSGNTANDTAYVFVPHDQSGHAIASTGFTADGTAILPDAPVVQLLVLTDAVVDAQHVEVDRAYVGDLTGALRPAASGYADANGDHLLDLVLTYRADEVRALLAASRGYEYLGLHYTTEAGVDYLVDDIFLLGAPVAAPKELTQRPGRNDGGEVASATTPSDPAEAAKNTLGQPAQQAENSAGPNDLVLGIGGRVVVQVFDVRGRLVATIADRILGPGSYDFRWDGRSSNGIRVPSGIYFRRVQAPGIARVEKVLVAR